MSKHLLMQLQSSLIFLMVKAVTLLILFSSSKRSLLHMISLLYFFIFIFFPSLDMPHLGPLPLNS